MFTDTDVARTINELMIEIGDKLDSSVRLVQQKCDFATGYANMPLPANPNQDSTPSGSQSLQQLPGQYGPPSGNRSHK